MPSVRVHAPAGQARPRRLQCRLQTKPNYTVKSNLLSPVSHSNGTDSRDLCLFCLSDNIVIVVRRFVSIIVIELNAVAEQMAYFNVI